MSSEKFVTLIEYLEGSPKHLQDRIENPVLLLLLLQDHRKLSDTTSDVVQLSNLRLVAVEDMRAIYISLWIDR